MPSVKFPLIFFAIDSSLHPEIRANQSANSAYHEEYLIFLTVATYIVKNGYQEAFNAAAALFEAVLDICHDNKTWDGFCFSSEASEEDAVNWGPMPWGVTGGDIVYAITLSLNCRIKAA